MKLDIYNQKGQKTKKQQEVADTVFAANVADKVLAQYVYVYLSNQREAIAHTKTRGDVSGGGRKPWQQKGTGRARAGSNRSPIWRKGGVTFGPSKFRNWKRKLNKQVKLAALRGAFSKLEQNKKLQIVEGLDFKESRLTLQAKQVWQDFGAPKKLSIITGTYQQPVLKAFANIPGVRVHNVQELNAYTLMTGGNVLLLQDALEYIDQHWSK